jgi:hypothetical protein
LVTSADCPAAYLGPISGASAQSTTWIAPGPGTLFTVATHAGLLRSPLLSEMDLFGEVQPSAPGFSTSPNLPFWRTALRQPRTLGIQRRLHTSVLLRCSYWRLVAIHGPRCQNLALQSWLVKGGDGDGHVQGCGPSQDNTVGLQSIQ